MMPLRPFAAIEPTMRSRDGAAFTLAGEHGGALAQRRSQSARRFGRVV